MSDPSSSNLRPITPIKFPSSVSSVSDTGVRHQCQTPGDVVLCERCGDAMYRMHAVWRCPACGFKTDCCGW